MFTYIKQFGSKFPEVKVYGGLNSLAYVVQATWEDMAVRRIEEDAATVRDDQYKYIVGNPTYIRNERLKDRGPWRDFYELTDVRNSDIAFFFIQRALKGGERKGVWY